MKALRRAFAPVSLLGPACAFALGAACVDLFHGTDFETLCVAKPNDPSCGADTGVEAAPPPIDAGVDRAKPKPDFCALDTNAAREKAIRVCAYLGACTAPIDERSFGDCAARAQLAFDCTANPTLRPAGAVDAFWSCMYDAATCKDVEACVYGAARQDCPSVAIGKFTSCADVGTTSVRLECTQPGSGPPSGVDACLLAGKKCTTQNDSFAQCTGPLGYGKCSANECRGTFAVDCDFAGGATTLDRGIDCATLGAGTCAVDDAGPACVPGAKAPPCDPDAGLSAIATCNDAGAAVACVGGKQITVDCQRLGWSCDETITAPSYDPTALCVKTTPCIGNDACDGDSLRGCGRNAIYTASCTTLGLGKCTPKPNGRASCGPPP